MNVHIGPEENGEYSFSYKIIFTKISKIWLSGVRTCRAEGERFGLIGATPSPLGYSGLI
jgi:hypothetical protein|tara:strand:- start:218 stop:394 length:177 start_codon:yes stop_codon:yes gene_type:complete